MAAAFVGFLRGEASTAQSLYILGDLFEHWVGDDALDDPFNAAVAEALRTLTSRRVAVRIMRGNRDFLLGYGFEKATGARLIEDPTVVDLYGRRTLLMHGDTLCTEDVRYLEFRARVRRPGIQRLFLALPKFVRLAIARRARRISERDRGQKDLTTMDVTAIAVEEALRAHACRHLIHGHTHRPATHALIVDDQSCERLVLADWYEQGEYLRCDAQGCRRQPLR